MDDDHRDLVNRLFATATAMLEETIELAVDGPSSSRSLTELASDGRRLASASRDIAIIAQAATIIAEAPSGRRSSYRY